MSDQREMTLDEYLASKLPDFHLARRQLQELREERDALAHRLAKVEEDKQDNSALAHWAGWKTRALKSEAECDALSRDLDAERHHRQAAERSEQALAAHVERLQQELRRCASLLHCNFPSTDKDKAHRDAVASLKDKPETSLARLKAEGIHRAVCILESEFDPCHPIIERLEQIEAEERRQAEGGE